MFSDRNDSIHPRANASSGFSLVELLVVIAIIGILSSLATVAVFQARDKAKLARAKGDVRQLVTAIQLLSADTGKWPNGCPVEAVSNPEINLTSAQAGIVATPTVGNQGGGCTWTAGDIGRWGGPYMQIVEDPWGNNYYFDPDFTGYANCGSETTQAEAPVVLSFGPNGAGLNDYDCDDIWAVLR